MNDRSIELSLRTWYPKDHLLHFDLHHPLGKLVGEWGELLDGYMKHLYKPGYTFEPEDELVDIWYYLRILAYQLKIEFVFIPIVEVKIPKIEYLITRAIHISSDIFIKLTSPENVNRKCPTEYYAFELSNVYSIFRFLCVQFNLTIDQLTEASWEKLKPGSERGDEWMKAPDNVEIWEK
ncbi:MAG TPA: hypothetical protein ENI23_07640 [bacterium]|nr:hypothetical protein [bacterium]